MCWRSEERDVCVAHRVWGEAIVTRVGEGGKGQTRGNREDFTTGNLSSGSKPNTTALYGSHVLNIPCSSSYSS